MSAGRQGKATNWEDDVIGTKIQDERQSMWGEIPGEIVSFDASKQTATVKPLYKPKFNGKPVDMPELLEIPVRFQRAGNGGITFPVAAGDKVTLRPQMRSSENYHTEDDGAASDARSFNLSDMEAHLDGGESLNDPIQGFDGENTHVRFSPDGGFGIRGSQDGKIAIEGSEGNIYELLGDAIDLTQQGFDLLSTEPQLIHTGDYASIASDLATILGKLRAMAL